MVIINQVSSNQYIHYVIKIYHYLSNQKRFRNIWLFGKTACYFSRRSVSLSINDYIDFFVLSVLIRLTKYNACLFVCFVS